MTSSTVQTSQVTGLFDDLFSQTSSILSEDSEFSLQDLELDTCFQNRSNAQSQVNLCSHNWSLQKEGLEFGDCRFVRIFGPKIDVVNAMFFPAFPNVHPIFAAELISFGGRGRIAFVDIQWPNGTQSQSKKTLKDLQKVLKQAHAQTNTAPEWATKYSSGAYYYHRGDGQFDLIDTFQSVYVSFLRIWRAVLASTDPSELSQSEAATTAQAKYKCHHAESTPGGQFLGNVFGNEWSQSFLNRFLYK